MLTWGYIENSIQFTYGHAILQEEIISISENYIEVFFFKEIFFARFTWPIQKLNATSKSSK